MIFKLSCLIYLKNISIKSEKREQKKRCRHCWMKNQTSPGKFNGRTGEGAGDYDINASNKDINIRRKT